MITIFLKGGLGNQFFQYAAARSLSLEYKLPICLDLSYYHYYDSRCFTLNNYKLQNVKYHYSKPRTLFDLKRYSLKVLKRLKGFSHSISYSEFKYETITPSIKKTIFMDGYFQNFKYFEKFSSVISNELIPAPISDLSSSSSIFDIIESSETLAVHIRRSDYLSSSNKLIYADIPIDYYVNSIEFIMDNCPHVHIFFFSDDPEWCRLNLLPKFTNSRLVNTGSADKDLYIMSLCNHHIIANSTFSLWSAWLSLNRNIRKGFNIYPQYWFIDPHKNNIFLASFPDSWIAM